MWATLTCKHCRGSSSHWGLGTLCCLSTGRWSCAAETAASNLNLCCIVPPLQWHHPDQSAWAHQTQWWTDEAGSPARPQSPEEKETDSEEAWPGRDTPAEWTDQTFYKKSIRTLANHKLDNITSIILGLADSKICIARWSQYWNWQFVS